MAVEQSKQRPSPMHRWRPRDPLKAEWLDEAVEHIQALEQGVAGPQQVMAKGTQAAGGSITQFRIKSVEDDYLVCERLVGSYENEGDDTNIWVAKPYLLRRTPFDASSRDDISYTYSSATARTATDEDSHTEDQIVVPSYVTGDVIYAAANVAGGTGVYVDVAGVDTAVTWLDLNVDGRAWAAA